ncbi:MAG: hypothetical protein QT08_C0020G0017 [archaeon GW2011_AR17]|nr:MAG: hypothetical protein QT08_C0020G0017 [archaeon GW2011_AR17]MBS3154061.1 hypothetical protein [Candidatus Woesearchaeota archaeon]HIH15549.1 hypothetical protein [Nanoarchaeota archaeon]HIH59119.1 hypothetical protein [Nanoarchaeota archaeon]HII14593.1 hypothetical protein [Nanoarchaeota archaeon]
MKDHEHEDLDTEEIAVAAYNKIDALLDLLIKKKIISEEEFEDAEEALWEELEADTDDDDDEDEED